MKNRGFTLIELIGVIVILSLLTLIIVPNVVTNLREGISDSKEYQNESVILGAKNWASDHKDELPESGEDPLQVQLSRLQDEGYSSSDIKDLESGDIIDPNSVCVVISTTNGKRYTYEIKDCS